MVQLALDKTVESSLAEQARAQGVRPEDLAIELLKTGLRANDETQQERRRIAIETTKKNREGRYLGLDGSSLRKFIHTGHKY